MADRPKLWFCFPYHGVGGVSLLFLRLAEAIAEARTAEVTLIDYPDGYMAQNLRHPGVNLASYSDDGALAIPADAVLVLQSMTPWSIFPGLRPAPQTRLLFWTCFPFNLVPPVPGLRAFFQHHRRLARGLFATAMRGFRNRMRRFVALLVERQALLFMDGENLRITSEQLGTAIPNPAFLAIPAGSAEARPDLPLHQPLQVVWVGRIVDFKFHSLARALHDLDRIASSLPGGITLTIIGDGEFRERLRREAAATHQVRVEFLDYVAPDQLDKLLGEKTDLLLAMGTAALEGAKLAVPTLLLDIAYRPLPADQAFRWLFAAKNCSLGDLATRPDRQREQDSLAKRVAELLADPRAIGLKCREHFTRNHALPSIAAGIIRHAATSRCTWADLESQGLLRPGRAYRLFVTARKRTAQS